jgi:hypothetical protein
MARQAELLQQQIDDDIHDVEYDLTAYPATNMTVHGHVLIFTEKLMQIEAQVMKISWTQRTLLNLFMAILSPDARDARIKSTSCLTILLATGVR